MGGPNLVWVKPAQHALAPDAAPLRFAAQVKRKPLCRSFADNHPTTAGWRMKHKSALISILLLLFLSAFSQNPKPLLSLPLPEGRTYDQAHDSGFIDWSGSVGYVYLHHKDNTSLPPEEGGTFCGNPGGCWEWVTRISNGGTVSGAFAPVDVAYFEVMVAFTHNSGAGTAILNACGSSAAWNLYVGPGSGLPGFVSMSVPVPSGCTSWSLSASGGYVDFRSVDAYYVSPPPPVSTNTFTPVPTETFTLSPTATETPTPTVTETLAPGVTPSDTPSFTPTSTPSATLPPGVTPSDTPVPPVWTNTPKPPSGGGITNPPIVPFIPVSTATQTRSVIIVPTTAVKTATPQPFSVVALPSLPVCGTPPSSTSSASGETNFPWWLLPAGMSLASALSLLNSYLKQSGNGKVASLAPSGIAVPVPKVIWNKTTVGEWVTRPVRTLVLVTRTIWKTITEAIPRFITITRQIVDKIVHSEWVTTFKQVAKTFWETVTEKVPLLGLFGKFLGFIWKTFIKPVVRWVTEAIRTLRTWVENVVRWVAEKIQDGWNYITRQIAETVREWVEKVEWIREWVTKEISVPEVVWEMEFVPLPFLNDLATIRRLLQLVTTVGLGAISLSMCTTPTPTSPIATPDIQATAACLVLTMQANAIQTARAAFTPTLVPTATPTSTPEPMPDILDRSKLSERANKFYDLYLAMYNDRNGWWWKEYGGDDGFTLKDFMAIMWSYDAQLDLDIVRDAMHNRAKTFCPGGCDPTTLEGSLVYLSVFAQSAFDRVNRWQPGTDPATVMDNAVVSKEAGLKIVDAVLTSDVTIQELLKSDPMAPFNYGNISLDPLYAEMVGRGWVLKSIPASSGDTFFVLSVCQELFYRHVKVGIAAFTQQDYRSYCP